MNVVGVRLESGKEYMEKATLARQATDACLKALKEIGTTRVPRDGMVASNSYLHRSLQYWSKPNKGNIVNGHEAIRWK